MKKAILIIDMPDSCKDCPLCAAWEVVPSVEEHYCIVENNDVDRRNKPDWCPLKPLPEKYDLEHVLYTRDWDGEYEHGYNACIDEILGN